MKKYDIVIIGAGIYGLHASLHPNFSENKVLIIEKEKDILTRASFINQARLHNGYHYPRSIQTAKASAKYFDKFFRDYSFAINHTFHSIYAISKDNSLTSKEEFEEFCNTVNIPFKTINDSLYFKPNMVSSAYETKEFVYDINLIRKYYLEKIAKNLNISISFNTFIQKAIQKDYQYLLTLSTGETICTDCVINTSYASVNQINELFNLPKYDIKYELCEVELGKANHSLKNVAVTVMDGPFFSIMPFGKTEYHSLTSVNHTPHDTCYQKLPSFECQTHNPNCNSMILDNCNNCSYRPASKEKSMHHLFTQYLKEDYDFTYEKSLFTIKPILLVSEQDDSRPTVITKHSKTPIFISCLSGKFNTMYLLDEFIDSNFKNEKEIIKNGTDH